MTVETYLKLLFEKTHWPFYGINQLMYDLRNDATPDDLKNQIRELRKAGIIKIVPGINGLLIQVLL